MKKIYVTLLTCIFFGFDVDAQCDDLFISEYIEGTGSNRALEIYNPTGQTVDLTSYKIYLINGGGGSGNVIFKMKGTLDPFSVYVIANTQADAAIQAVADTALSFPSIVHYSGDDGLALIKGTDTIDGVGERWKDPGTSWPVGSGSTKDHTLVRMTTVKSGETDWSKGANEWDVYASNNFDDLGSHTSYCAYRRSNIIGARTADANLFITNKGQNVEVTGFVYGLDLDGNAGLSFTIIDATAGINIYNFRDVSNYIVKEGDEITVRGEMDFYNGLTLITADSIRIVSKNNVIKDPVEVDKPAETTESDYIKVSKIWIVDGTTEWPSNGDVWVTNEKKDTFQVRIDKDVTEIVGNPVLYDTMNITGIGGQFVVFAPYNEGYQIFPHYLTNIEKWVDKSNITDLELISHIYPNPTTGTLFIKTLQQVRRLKVTNLFGQVVLEGANINSNNFDLDLNHLTKGIYFIHVGAKNIESVEKIILK